MMNWREYIDSDPTVLAGKPTVKGTRLAVEFVLELLANGWTEEEILENYPTLSHEKLQSVFAYTAECMREEALYLIPKNKGDHGAIIGQ